MNSKRTNGNSGSPQQLLVVPCSATLATTVLFLILISSALVFLLLITPAFTVSPPNGLYKKAGCKQIQHQLINAKTQKNHHDEMCFKLFVKTDAQLVSLGVYLGLDSGENGHREYIFNIFTDF